MRFGFRKRAIEPSGMVPEPPTPEVLASGAGPAEEAGKGRTLRADAWRRLRKNKLAMAALVWIAFVVLVAVSADLWVPRVLGDPIYIDTTKASQLSLKAPSAEHPFGTDKMGRDVLSRVIYGGTGVAAGWGAGGGDNACRWDDPRRHLGLLRRPVGLGDHAFR